MRKNILQNLYIITGTTKGLGKELFELLKNNNYIITINRHDFQYTNTDLNYNLYIDLKNLTKKDLINFDQILSYFLLKKVNKIIFINNAFCMGNLSKITQLDNEDIVNSFHINLISSIQLIKTFLSKTQNLSIDKKIINISSGAARRSIEGWSIYCISKAGMEMFLNSIMLEYPDYKCYNFDPGVMNTQMQQQIRNFVQGVDNKYFVDLNKNQLLKNPNDVASKIIEEYL